MTKAVPKPITEPAVVTAQELAALAERLRTRAIEENADPDAILVARIIKRMVTNGDVITSISLPPLVRNGDRPKSDPHPTEGRETD